MGKYLWAYLGTAVVFCVLDFVWLGFVATGIYRSAIGHLMADQPRLGPAALFYLLYCVGLVVFVVLPTGADQSIGRVAGYGALFGFFAYLTYDLSNLATLRNWPVSIALIDIAWGSALSCAASVGGYWAASFNR